MLNASVLDTPQHPLHQLAMEFGVDNAEIRVELMTVHLVGLAFARYQLKIEPMASAGLEGLVAWMGPTVQRYLTDPNP
ncbi:hypothetical protein JVX93_22000 [Mycolicibacterium boenickei]|nr:hypothetical protein JVX93_22000 [Mycolicibacterium boenickei]